MKEHSELYRYLEQIKLPKFYKARQHLDSASISRAEIPSVLRERLEQVPLREQVKPGMRIAVTAGSRGVANIDLIIGEIVKYLKGLQAEPFIVPSMGSHGGGTAQGQLEILAGYGITEETMGCPLISSMEVTQVGETEDKRPVYIDRAAAEADGILVVGRIKPHTGFRGPYQSGLMKMMAIGLGKQYGARVCHEEGFKRMGYNVEMFGRAVIQNCNIVCAVGLIENAFETPWKIEAMKNISSERILYFSDIYEHLEAQNATRQKKEKIRKFCKEILEFWIQKNYIRQYCFNNKGRAIYSITIFL